jgi:RNA polymerase sigma-70 factor (ECF subfamily)
MRAVAVHLLGPGPDADDAVQDACIHAMVHVGQLRNPDAARTWLVAIVANACRARRRRPHVELPTLAVEDRAVTEDPVERAIEESALHDWIWAALERLSPPLRAALVLRYFSAASSYQAIAQLCGVPVGTIRSRLNAARGRLADELLSEAAAATSTRIDDAVPREAGEAMAVFQQTGDARVLGERYAADLRFQLYDAVPHTGLARYAAAIAADFADGVRGVPLRYTTASDLTVMDLRLDNPADQPLHCPALLTQVYVHDRHQVRRITSYYRPDAP